MTVQITYMLGKNDKSNITYDWMSQVIPLIIVFLIMTIIFYVT